MDINVGRFVRWSPGIAGLNDSLPIQMDDHGSACTSLHMERLIAWKILNAILIIMCFPLFLTLALSLSSSLPPSLPLPSLSPSLSLGDDRDKPVYVGCATAFIADLISAIINPRRGRYVAAAYVRARRPAFSTLL
jgi:hypothetical protein